MTAPVLHWAGTRPPTRAELQAIGRAWRAGLIPPGARVGCATCRPATAAELERVGNPGDPDVAAARGRIAKLRYELRTAREQSAAEVRALRSRRDLSRRRLSAQLAALRARWRAEINARLTALRAEHRRIWAARIARAKLPTETARAALEAERGYQADWRRERRRAREAKRRDPRRRAVARVRKSESDFEVEGNLSVSPELIPIWRRMKNRIRTRVPHKSRTEAFLEWVEENAAEVARMQAEAFEGDDLEQALAAQEAAYYSEVAA